MKIFAIISLGIASFDASIAQNPAIAKGQPCPTDEAVYDIEKATCKTDCSCVVSADVPASATKEKVTCECNSNIGSAVSLVAALAKGVTCPAADDPDYNTDRSACKDDCVCLTSDAVPERKGEDPKEDLTCECGGPKILPPVVLPEDGAECPAAAYPGMEIISDCTAYCDCVVTGRGPSANDSSTPTVNCGCHKVCPEDAHVCPDGTVVVRDPAKDCKFPACPSVGYTSPKKGELCDHDALKDNAFSVTKPCCITGDDKNLCNQKNVCRIQKVDLDKKEVECRCQPIPKKNDKCNEDTLCPTIRQCDPDCPDCRIKEVKGKYGDEIVCGCVDTGGVKCDCHAYDDPKYCRDSKYVEVEAGKKFEVSVCGDATYEIEVKAGEKICSGHGPTPAGEVCPKKGAKAIKHCRPGVFSHEVKTDGETGEKTGECILQHDSVCKKMAGPDDTFGCVIEANNNVKNGCLTENICKAEYAKAGNTEVCDSTENGYPIIDATKVPADEYVDTTKLVSQAKNLIYQAGQSGLGTITNVVSVLVGAVTTLLSIVTSL